MSKVKRSDKLSRQLHKDLSTLFVKNYHDWFKSEFITISGVEVTPDLSIATVYISLYNSKNRENVMEMLVFNNAIIRRELARLIKNQVKKIPELRFFEDASLDAVNKIDALLKSVKKDDEES